MKGIIVPKSFSEQFKQELSDLAEIIEIPESIIPIKINPGIYSSGVMGTNIKEHSLFLQTHSNQVMIVAGCSHPSPVDFMVSAKKIAPIFGVAGGIHGFKEIEVFKNLKLIIPIHCTKAQQEILKQFPRSARLMMVGEMWELEKIAQKLVSLSLIFIFKEIFNL